MRNAQNSSSSVWNDQTTIGEYKTIFRPIPSIQVKTPRLFRVIVPVTHIEKAVVFYTALFDLEGRRVSSGRHYFDLGGTILACYDAKADGDDRVPPPNPEHIYIAVEDLEGTYEKAKMAGPMEMDDSIKKRPWGERSFYLKDPFGNPLCFVDDRTMFTGV